MSLARGIAECEWLRSILAEATHPSYKLKNKKILRERVDIIETINNRPNYYHVVSDGIVIRDKWMAIDMLITRRDIRKNNISLRWVDSKYMLAGSLSTLNTSAD